MARHGVHSFDVEILPSLLAPQALIDQADKRFHRPFAGLNLVDRHLRDLQTQLDLRTGLIGEVLPRGASLHMPNQIRADQHDDAVVLLAADAPP